MSSVSNHKAGLRSLPDDYRFGEREVVPEVRAENEAIMAQSVSEGVNLPKDDTGDLDRRVTVSIRVNGNETVNRSYRIADKVGLMPLMKFAYNASGGIATDDMRALSAIYEMLRDCLHDAEWDRFQSEMTELKADAEDMLPIVQQTIEILTARPTRPVSGSSQQSATTPDTLTDTSSGQREGLVPVMDLGKVAGSSH
jgi:hypothetical protein